MSVAWSICSYPWPRNEILWMSAPSESYRWSKGRGYPPKEKEGYLIKGKRMQGGQKHRRRNLTLLFKDDHILILCTFLGRNTEHVHVLFHLINILGKQESCTIRFIFYYCRKYSIQSLNNLFKIIPLITDSNQITSVQMCKPSPFSPSPKAPLPSDSCPSVLRIYESVPILFVSLFFYGTKKREKRPHRHRQ